MDVNPVPKGTRSNHTRYHVKRGRRSATCRLCTPAAAPRPKHRIVLEAKDVDALRQLIERVEHLTQFVRTLVGADR